MTHARLIFATGLLDFEGKTDEAALNSRVEALGYRLSALAAAQELPARAKNDHVFGD